MKKFIIYAALVCALVMSGCTFNKNVNEIDSFTNYLLIEKDGRIKENICEVFEKDYYSVEGLVDMVKADIADYDINLSEYSFDETSKKVSITLVYEDYKTYNSYNGCDIFYGTVEEAINNALLNNKTVIDSKSQEVMAIDKENMKKYFQYHIFLTDENVDLYVPSKLKYLDENAILVEKDKVAFTESTQNHIIIFK